MSKKSYCRFYKKYGKVTKSKLIYRGGNSEQKCRILKKTGMVENKIKYE
jgi:hypothetical protein